MTKAKAKNTRIAKSSRSKTRSKNSALKAINFSGKSNYVLPLAFMVLFAVVGAAYLVASYADTTTASPETVADSTVYVNDPTLVSGTTSTGTQLPTPVDDSINQSLTSGVDTNNETLVAKDHNWAGFVATNHDYNTVQGTLTFPRVDCNEITNPYPRTATWLGLGGWPTVSDPAPTLEQTGFSFSCTSKNTVSYNVWWEIFPSPSEKYASQIKIHGGDTVVATVSNEGGGNFSFSLDDTTDGQSTGGNHNCNTVLKNYGGGPCTTATADWVTERFPGQAYVYPASGILYFNNDTASTSANSTLQPISSFRHTRVDALNNSGKNTVLDTNGLSNNGENFTIDYVGDSGGQT